MRARPRASTTTASATISWTIATVAPVITVTGVQNGAYYDRSVTPVITVTDLNPGVQSALLNGAAFVSGTAVTAEGNYVLTVTASDRAQNAATPVTVSFVIDKTPPAIVISGVTDGEVTNSPVTPVVTVTDAHPGTQTITLDGQPFVSHHSLVATATDLATNIASRTVQWTIGGDLASPAMSFSVCAFGKLDLSNNAQIVGVNPITHAVVSGANIATHGTLTIINNASNMGSAVVGGNIVMKNNATIFGNVYVGGTVQLQNNAKIRGTRTTVTPPPQPCECGYDIEGALAEAVTDNDDALLRADPAIASHLVGEGLLISGNSTVMLPAGDFYLTQLRIENNGRLAVATDADVRLFVAGNVLMLNNADLNCPPTSGASLLIISDASAAVGGQVILRNNSDNVVSVYAPLADITLQNNGSVYGQIVGHNVAIKNNAAIRTDAMGPTVPPLVCPDGESP